MIKKILSIVSLTLIVTFNSNAQTVQDIFNTNIPVTWFGIDYSHVKIVGTINQFGGKTPVTATELHDTYYTEWNHLILDEPEKYDIAKMINRRGAIKDIGMITALNAASSMDSVEVAATPYYSQEQIQKFVSAYPIENKKGIGLVFIAECMNKSYGGAYYHVVFFKIDTKEILLQERVQGMVMGVGIRNYWAGSYLSVIDYIKDDRYPKWKKRYGASSNATEPKW
ncbi:MAG TPA: hypothetical protein VK796_13470 [Cytophaga sp.]|jgi:hypothetical protein|nr:hypothetical protein [Cytophaga sp.]